MFIIQQSGKYKMVQLMDVVQLINTRASFTNSAVQHYHMQYTGAELSILICIVSTRSRCLIFEGHLMYTRLAEEVITFLLTTDPIEIKKSWANVNWK